jgi:hypothetical protein
MLIPVIGMRVEEEGPTRYSWQCRTGTECQALVHLGYSSVAAARRAYDRHLKAEHPAVSAA